ncbi:hypothetical protein FRC09_020484 [Ceratobasidium sp. 395]|nr:hypothetical protein FRC09_020484 [Ceratobasidium sp. 395]
MQTARSISSPSDEPALDITWPSLDSLSTISSVPRSRTVAGSPSNITWPSPPSINASHSDSLSRRELLFGPTVQQSPHRTLPADLSAHEPAASSPIQVSCSSGPADSPLLHQAFHLPSDRQSPLRKRHRTASAFVTPSKRPRPSTTTANLTNPEPGRGDHPEHSDSELPKVSSPPVASTSTAAPHAAPATPIASTRFGSASSSGSSRSVRVPRNSPVYRYILAREREAAESRGSTPAQGQSPSGEQGSSGHRDSSSPSALSHGDERNLFSPPHTPRAFRHSEPIGSDVEEPHDDESLTASHINRSQVVAYGKFKPKFYRPEDPRLAIMFAEPCHNLYQWVFYASLFHSVYRPLDLQRVLLVFGIPAPHSPYSKLRFEERPPTHCVGLWQDESGTSVLVWGKTVQREGSELSLQVVMFDSRGTLRDVQDIQPFLKRSRTAIQKALGAHYTLELKGRLGAWPRDLLDAPERAKNWSFCQLISTVVHEFPWRTGVTAYPVDPVWPTSVVEDRTRALLEQFSTSQVTARCLLERGHAVPLCVYLHGDLVGVGNFEEEDEMADVEDYQADDDDEPIGGPEAVPQRVIDLHQVGNQVAYVKVSRNGTEYQEEAPVDFDLAASAESVTSEESEHGRTADEVMQIETSLAELHEARAHGPTARLAFWHQLRESKPSPECISFVTCHLWLSSLLAQPDSNVFYIDPVLAEDLISKYEEDPLDVDVDALFGLWERHNIWPAMGREAVVVVLCRLKGVTAPRERSWVLASFIAKRGRVRRIDMLFPPLEGFSLKAFTGPLGKLMSALSLVLPGLFQAEITAKMEQTVYTLVLPDPYTDEDILLTMMGHLCGAFLGQDASRINVEAVRQGLCFYYDAALRVGDINSSFPWRGLTDQEGNLLVQECEPVVAQRRFSLATNRQPPRSEAFPRRRSYAAALVVAGPAAPFFAELAQAESTVEPDMLLETSGRSVEELDKALFLGHYPSWPESMPDEALHTPEALSLDDYRDKVQSMGGPRSLQAQRFLVTGKHEDRRITLDWLKETAHLNKDWLIASTDVDSLSLTTQEAPTFLEAGSYYPYPSRALSLTNRNNLKVSLNGQTVEMHTCPNFCVASFGPNNQFRFLVFFPGCKEMVNDRMWRNLPTEVEMTDWYHVFLAALTMARGSVPVEYLHAIEKTIEAMPPSYRAAQDQTQQGSGGRSFVGLRIEPVILNRVFELVRALIDTRPRYQKYRGYFFHLCGINLKLATQTIHGREAENPLNYAFRVNRFVDWCQQNPHNIVVDVGLAINLDPALVPEEIQRSTLLIRHDPLRELLRPGYNQPQRDHYCHSFVISGLRSAPSSKVRKGAGVMKVQAYHKDMVLTYRHRDKSTGANFTTNQALGLGDRQKFQSQTVAFQRVVNEGGSYGIRLEWRLSPWAANRAMLVNPRDILDRLFDSGAIVCLPTETVSSHKILLSQGWAGILDRQSKLDKRLKQSPEVALLASVVSYWLKGLVKRPDEMSSTRQMAQHLHLVSNAKTYGLPSMPSRCLDETGLQVSYELDAASFAILDQLNVNRPGGNRIKGSKTLRVIPAPDPVLSPPPSPGPAQPRLVNGPPRLVNAQPRLINAQPRLINAQPHRVNEALWNEESERFLTVTMDRSLPRALWREVSSDVLVKGNAADKARNHPLRVTDWGRVAEPLAERTVISKPFGHAINKLFPRNWASDNPGYATYDQGFLARIRWHIETKPEQSRARYSELLRGKIEGKLYREWEFLPAPQANTVWPYDLKDGIRHYRIIMR